MREAEEAGGAGDVGDGVGDNLAPQMRLGGGRGASNLPPPESAGADHSVVVCRVTEDLADLVGLCRRGKAVQVEHIRLTLG